MCTDYILNKNNDTSFHIALSVENDDDFLCMGTAIASILENNPLRKFIFHVFAFSISQAQAQRLSVIERNRYAKITEHIVDWELLYDFSELLQLPCSLKTFSRLIGPSILSESTDAVLYLDVNVLCLGNIEKIALTDISNTVALGVRDMASDGKTINKMCINTSILLINIRAWEKYRVTDEAIRIQLASDEKRAFDEKNSLDISVVGRTDFFPSEWGCIYNMSEALRLREHDLRYDRRATFIQFSGPIKPLHDWISHDARYLFEKYHRLSAWRDAPAHGAPVNYKEVRQYCRILEKQKRYLYAFYWHMKQIIYLTTKKMRSKLQH